MSSKTSTQQRFGLLSVRKPDFGLKSKKAGAICAKNHYQDALLSSLSTFLPPGERFFINALRKAKEHIKEDAVAEEIQRFIGQEAQHSKQHIELNRYLESCGYPALSSESFIEKMLKIVADVTPAMEDQLAITVVIEHFTAVLSNIYLNDKELQDGLDSPIAELYQWHAIEEIEHKSVAYDIYQELVNSYPKRVAYMTLVLISFTSLIVVFPLIFLHSKDRLLSLKSIRQIASFWNHNRVVDFFKGIAEFYSPSFHPWNIDDRHLLSGLVDNESGKILRNASISNYLAPELAANS